ncbi:MAG: BamA/TamA family outer membrane protein [Mariprofundales bacterium]
MTNKILFILMLGCVHFWMLFYIYPSTKAIAQIVDQSITTSQKYKKDKQSKQSKQSTKLQKNTANNIDILRNSPLALPESVKSLLDTPVLLKSTTTTHGKINNTRIRYAAKRDAETLRDWLRSESYLDAEVTVIPPASPNKSWSWQINAGSLWHIATVDINPKPAPEVALPRIGSLFRSASYNKQKQDLRFFWQDRGFLLADYAKAQVLPNHKEKTVHIIWQINTRQLFHISSIEVQGAQQYNESLARDLSALHAGQEVRANLLRDAGRLVSQDGHYKQASVLPQLGSHNGEWIPVRLQVQEAPRRELLAEAGYSRDAGISIGSGWTDRGLWQGLLEYQLRANASQAQRGVGMTLARPAWPNNRDKSGIRLDVLRESTHGKDFSTLTGGPFWRRQFNYRDNVYLSLQQQWVANDLSTLAINEQRVLRILEAKMQLHIERRKYHKGLPFQGWLADGQLSFPWQLGNNGRWTVVRIDARAYWQPWQLLYKLSLQHLLQLALRGGYGRVLSLDNNPPPKPYRLFLGGQNSLRGYALDSIGPIGSDGLAQGGLHAAYGGLDIVLWPQADIAPVIFTDIGKIWNSPTDYEPLSISAGIGLLATTPIGFIRFDIAAPLRRRKQDATFQFYISIGDVL